VNNMANAIITFKIMPDDAGVDLDTIKNKSEEIVKESGSIGDLLITEQPIAFGLKAVIVKAMFPVDGIDFDAIAAKMAKLENVQTADVAGMDLPLG
jgi:elongation factor 1-beta